MSRLAGVGVRRLRTLFDLGTPIRLTPITVLIGRNSAGKSTFARLLPLLRQSAERRKRGPILWFDDLVDFGTLGQAVTRGEHDLELILELDDLDDQRVRFMNTFWGEAQVPNPLAIRRATVSLTLAADLESGATYAKKVDIYLADTTVRLQMDSPSEVSGVWIGDVPITWQPDRIRIRVEQGSLLPRLRFLERKKTDENLWQLVRNPWRSAVSDFVHRYVHGNTSRGTTARIASQIPVAEPEALTAAIQKIDGPPSWISARASASTSQYFLRRLTAELLIANVDSLLERLDDAASEAARGVRYLKPLRATAERYYRRADLAVSEIDPEGRNLPMFLDSLTSSQLADFRTWLQSSLDIDVEPRREGAQVVLLARASTDSGSSNVADMGFGISQVLPIAAQLWAARSARTLIGGPATFVVVEQPELHLHPAFQAKLADLMAGIVRSDGKMTRGSPRIVLETHSQHLVNRLGLLIESGQLKATDVSIVLFESDPDRAGTSRVRVSTFDDGGVLQNWPFGFFEPDQ